MPCIFTTDYQKSVFTVALLLHASGTNTKTCLVGEMRVGDLRVGEMRIYPCNLDPELEWTADCGS